MGDDAATGTEEGRGATETASPPRAPVAADEIVLALLRALAEPNRLRLFRALQERERCVRDLVDTEGLPQPLVSHHLGVLVRAGLARARRADGFTMYSLDLEGVDSARELAAELLSTRRLSPSARPGGNPACCRPAPAVASS